MVDSQVCVFVCKTETWTNLTADIVSLEMSEKCIDAVSPQFVIPSSSPLSPCGVGESDELLYQKECSSEGGEALFLSERCIFLLSKDMSASASP